MSRMVINDEMWFRLERLLLKTKARHGRDDRLFMEAIFWMLRDRCSLAGFATRLWSWKSVYNRYNNWSKKGYITAILGALKISYKTLETIDPKRKNKNGEQHSFFPFVK